MGSVWSVSCLLLLIAAPLSAASTITGYVRDAKTNLTVSVDAGDTATWRLSPSGSVSPISVYPAEPGLYVASVPSSGTYRIDFALAGYEVFQIDQWVSVLAEVDYELIRSSRMASITWAGDATELDEGQILVGTISLDTAFPKADTEISLAAILGDADRFELRDAAGDPLVGDLVIPAGDTSVDFQVYAVPNAVIEGAETLTLRATCDQIPVSAVDLDDQTLDAPSLTLNEVGRVVRLRYDGEAGTLNRYTDLAGAIAGDPPDGTDVTDGSGWAGFWSGDTAEAAGYHFVPTVVKPTSN